MKLETELKIRAYVELFAGTAAAKFVQRVQRFEIELSQLTEECHRNRSWPELDAQATPDDVEFKAILLMIRRMAAQHLGANHGRPNDWLEEYISCWLATVSLPGVLKICNRGERDRQRLDLGGRPPGG